MYRRYEVQGMLSPGWKYLSEELQDDLFEQACITMYEHLIEVLKEEGLSL